MEDISDIQEKDYYDIPGEIDFTKNVVILREFANISRCVSTEEFLNIMPKTKLKRVKWKQMFEHLQQGMLDTMLKVWNEMWEEEGMSDKMKILDKQKEKFSGNSISLWRPQLGDVSAQLRANDVAELKKQKRILEAQAKDYETRVAKLKKNLTAKRGFLRALQMDIQKYQKRNNELCDKMDEKLKERSKTAVMLNLGQNEDYTSWAEEN